MVSTTAASSHPPKDTAQLSVLGTPRHTPAFPRHFCLRRHVRPPPLAHTSQFFHTQPLPTPEGLDYSVVLTLSMGFSGGTVGRNPPAEARDASSIPGWARSPGGGHGWQPTPVFLTGEFHRAWKAAVRGVIELDTPERLSTYEGWVIFEPSDHAGTQNIHEGTLWSQLLLP